MSKDNIILRFEDKIRKLGFHIEFVTYVYKYDEWSKYTLVKEYYVYKKKLGFKKLLDCNVLVFNNYKFGNPVDLESLILKLNNMRRIK